MLDPLYRISPAKSGIVMTFQRIVSDENIRKISSIDNAFFFPFTSCLIHRFVYRNHKFRTRIHRQRSQFQSGWHMQKNMFGLSTSGVSRVSQSHFMHSKLFG